MARALLFEYYLQAEAAGKCAVIRIIHKKSPFMAKNGVSDSITLHGIGKINSCKTAIEYFDPTNPETYPDRVYLKIILLTHEYFYCLYITLLRKKYDMVSKGLITKS